jgi:hypothetical protein
MSGVLSGDVFAGGVPADPLAAGLYSLVFSVSL